MLACQHIAKNISYFHSHDIVDANAFLEIWTGEQDERLKELVSQHGMGWTKIGEVFGERNGKQCRERWYNHLDPAVNKGEWTLEVPLGNNSHFITNEPDIGCFE